MKKRILSILFALLIVITLVPVKQTNAATSIPTDAKEYNGNYYYIYQQSCSWESAKSNCESVGGHLTVITSSDEQQFLEEYIGSGDNSYWIGGLRKSDTWSWITGEPWEFTNWNVDRGYPSNSTSDNYLGFSVRRNFKWYNEANTYSSITGYICEWEGNDITISLPSKVRLSSVKKASSTSANITWKEVKYAEGYSVYMKTGADSIYEKIADIDVGDVTTYSKTKLTNGITYYFIVRAYKTIFDEKSYGELSGAKKLTIK